MTVDPISLEIFRNLFSSIADEMGVVLGRTAYSSNIKERRDYSCALFDPDGVMVAQAAHIPVHLGAMTSSVNAALTNIQCEPGDIVILNDPYLGGTHLPDITLVAPVFIEIPDENPVLVGFVANRGHHADVGGKTPGSLSISKELYEEGLIIPPVKLFEKRRLNQPVIDLITRNSRTPDQRRGDFSAQIAAIRTGENRVLTLVARYGLEVAQEHMDALLDYSETLTRKALTGIPSGEYRFSDIMDEDGVEGKEIPIVCNAIVDDGEITFDFTGTASQSDGCINAPLAVTESAALYVVRCLSGFHIPSNDGCRRPITIIAPKDSLVNASPSGAVSGGNVETSQRIVDVLLGCLAQAIPATIPAASQGTMNNLLIGGKNPISHTSYVYYETIGGGMGAGPAQDGASGVQSHMTNTLNTPVEALEFEFPLRIRQYSIRRGTGGIGKYRGGDGILREIEFLGPAHVTILAERRLKGPYGLMGGKPGGKGIDFLWRSENQTTTQLPAKISTEVSEGDVLSIGTPGGGGYGRV